MRGSRGGRDRWMVTYADLITLLLIFFVVLYAMSSLDEHKYGSVVASLQNTFHHSGAGVLDGDNGVLDGAQGSEDGEPTADTDNEAAGNGGSSPTDGGQVAGAGGAAASPAPGASASAGPVGGAGSQASAPPSERELAFRKQEEKLSELMGVITQYIKANNLGDQIFVQDKPQGIAITLSDRFLFDVGEADLKSGAYPALRQLSGLFRNLGAIVSIEGHTDNTPVLPSSPYKDNWELSGARALSVLRFFLESEKLDPAGFQYAGYADTRPAADNGTAAGKQKNRRVEIIVLRQLQEE